MQNFVRLFPFFFLGVFHLLQGQEMARSVIAAGGKHTRIGEIQVSQTIGEAVVGTGRLGGLQISEGFQVIHPLRPTPLVPQILRPQWKVFPNPVMEGVYVHFPQEGLYQASVMSMDGKVLIHRPASVPSLEISVPMTHLPAGQYLLKVTSLNPSLSIFYAIQKQHN